LGPLEVRARESLVPLTAAKQKAILALLLLSRGETVSVDRLKEALWDDSPPTTAGTALQGYVSQLRRMLESGVEGGGALIATSAPGYSLTAAPEQVDLSRFEQLTAKGRDALAAGESDRAAALLAEALGLWRGPPLADFSYEVWAQAPIGRLEDLRLSAIEDRIEADLACGRQGELVGELESLVAEHPLRERLRGQLMLALYRSGRQADALGVYQAARHVLVDELGIEPSPELQDLNRAVLNQDRELAAPVRHAKPAVIRVPVPPSRLVGRARELEELIALMRRDEVRLLTLTGPGGIGKTRLALELARATADAYADGVAFVALAPLAEPSLVIPAVAQALEVTEKLEDAIREERRLLVLDNFEHVLAAATAVADLLAWCPGLNVVITSRARIHVAGEHEYAVPPLNEHEAVDLFVARAGSAGLSIEPDDVVDEICLRLEGLPLAIELAAARVKVLSPRALLRRLGKRLPLLTGGARDLPERQQTVRGTIEWSYELLDSDEQDQFTRLAVFAGGCTAEAANEVCGADLDVLSSLVDNSLLRREEGADDEPRFSMLETIREYAFELLEESESADALRLRHLRFFTKFAERAHVELRGPNKAEWLERLQADLENARAGLAWRPDTTDPAELQLRLAAALRLFWDSAGSLSEGRRWIEEGLARVDAPAPEVRYEAYIGASAFASQQRDFEQAFEYDDLALAAARELDDPTSIATAMMRTAIDARLTDQLPRARELYEKAREYAERDGNIHLAGAITHNLGDLALYEGDFQRARDLFHDALANARARSDPHETAYALCNIALASLRLDPVEVSECLREALTILATLSWPVGVAYGVELVGDAIGTEDAEGAARLFAAAEAMRSQLELPLDTFEQQLHDESLALVRASIPAEQYSAISDEGRLMTAHEAISYGLERLDASGPSRS
jgi:predicted ATPase/DNA-binding SARP family transcriptional activator